jgi:hypothetical protein
MAREGGNPISRQAEENQPDNIVDFPKKEFPSSSQAEKSWAIQETEKAREKRKHNLSDEEKKSVERIYKLFNNLELNPKTSSAEPKIIAEALFKKEDDDFLKRDITFSSRQQEDYIKFIYNIIKNDKEIINDVLKLNEKEWNNFYFRVLRILSEYRKLVSESEGNKTINKNPEVTIANEK